MFSAVLGLFSQDLAVDPGSCRTRVHLRGSGPICDEATVVAVRTDRRARRRVIAIGDEALPMLGRAPADIEVVQPIRAGRVVDFEVAEAFLLHLVRRIHGRASLFRPRMVVALPASATEMEVRAVRDSCESAGARDVQLVPRPVAAALGAGLPIAEPSGHLVVDVGAGTTEVSVLSLNGVVRSAAVGGGGDGMNEAIARWLEQERRLLVGPATAERLKIELGAALPPGQAHARIARGRCLDRGIPWGVEVFDGEVFEALRGTIHQIAAAIRAAVEQVPPELASDIVDHGVVLCGGGSRLRDLDRALRHHTGLPVVCAESPDLAVVNGAGRVLEEEQLLTAVAC